MKNLGIVKCITKEHDNLSRIKDLISKKKN